MFESKHVYYYLFAFSVITLTSYLATKVKNSFTDNDEYELIRKYLLNDSPLYGFNKPKLWIHTKYEINSRKWKSFYSRNSTDLNEPYIHLTIKTLINHCGDDFNICLIDDETFSKLIPSWDIDLSTVAEPMKTHYREIGLLKLVYYYGGMVVPNSFVCSRNLKGLYTEGIANGKPFFCQKVNGSVNVARRKSKLLFVPDTYFYGAAKNDETIKALIKYLKVRSQNPHFTSEIEFLGDTSEWLINAHREQKIEIVSGDKVGIKTRSNKPITIDELLGEDFLDLPADVYGVYIDNDEILRRTRYQWFAVISSEELFAKSNAIIVKYLKSSVVDSNNEYTKSSEVRSVVAI
jgi:hypothetical protein